MNFTAQLLSFCSWTRYSFFCLFSITVILLLSLSISSVHLLPALPSVSEYTMASRYIAIKSPDIRTILQKDYRGHKFLDASYHANEADESRKQRGPNRIPKDASDGLTDQNQRNSQHSYQKDGDGKLEMGKGYRNRSICDGKRIYTYELPPEFNTDILKDCEYQITSWLNFCTEAENGGFGKWLDMAGEWQDWLASDSYMLEVVFHHRMPHYECLTHDPLQADAFFIPYYSGLDALHFLYGKNSSDRASHGLKLVSWLHENAAVTWRRHGGHDHFIVMGRTAWDFSRLREPVNDGWGTSLRVLNDMENVTAFFLEKRPWVWNDQAIPYPTAFHPTSMENLLQWQSNVRASQRSALFAFVGAPRHGEGASRIRQAVIDQCINASFPFASMPRHGTMSRDRAGVPPSSSGCILVDCQKMDCFHNPKPIAEQLLQAQFCLQPPGDTTTRRSTFDGMLSGCIPVFFHNDSAYTQYQWHLPDDPDEYSVFIDAKNVHKVQQILSSYSAQRINAMREAIINMIPRIIYRSPKARTAMVKDAFDVAVERMTERVAEHKLKQQIRKS